MEYEEYINRSNQASHLIESGRLKEALVSLYELFPSDLSYYAKDTHLELSCSRFEAAGQNPHYLSLVGHSQEAVPIYESLITKPFDSQDHPDPTGPNRAPMEMIVRFAG